MSLATTQHKRKSSADRRDTSRCEQSANLTDGREGVGADELAVEPEEHDVDEAEREADERQLVQTRQRRAQTAMQQSAAASPAVSYIIIPHHP